MPILSPILLPTGKKNERQTKGLRGFYLIETSAGAQGIVGAIDLSSLKRVQRSHSQSSPKLKGPGKLFHAVHWGDLANFQLDTQGPELLQDGSRLARISESTLPTLINFFSNAPVCVIGDEATLEAAIAAGRTTVPIALWNAEDPNLTWLPCHRVLRDVDWYQSGWMVCLAREHMFFRDVTAMLMNGRCEGPPFDPQVAEQLLLPQNSDETAVLLAISRDGAWRIHSEAGWADGLLQELHPVLRETAVIQLHSIVLPRGLSLKVDDGSQDNRISVAHSAERAVAELDKGAQVAYLLRPIHSAKLKELVQHGQMLPAESVALDTAALEGWTDAE